MPSIPNQLFEAIKHGDLAHQLWLKEAIHCFFNGLPIPPVVLKETKND